VPLRRPRENFVDRITLKRIDRDIFTGACHAGAPQRAFGGQVAAQSLVAAGMTVDDPARMVHSLHSYFLRPGRTSDAIVYLVDRPRDGGSFSTRRVTAVQYGETIFTMSASFAIREDGPEHQYEAPDVPDPESLPKLPLELDSDHHLHNADSPDERLLDLRFVELNATQSPTPGRPLRAAWVRARYPLPDDQRVHACALTYFSDLTLVGTALKVHGGREENADLMLASIDHAMWFQSPFRADEWLLFVQNSPVSGGGHGLTSGIFYTQEGRLVATAAQEILMRRRRSKS
jgi:acyl-CoA thioesterase-2